MKKLVFILFLLIGFYGFSYPKENPEKVEWNGYAQLRASSNFNDYSSVMVRRLKFWLKSTPEFSKHWSYKIQTTFSSLYQEMFFLQDVKAGYQCGLFSVDLGQFVPQYSLQRFQHDFEIAPIERAIAINALIPNGTLGVRDIGMQVNFRTANNLIETHLGAFNGYGIKEYRFDNEGYMFSHKTAMNIQFPKSKLQVGYSLMYRYAQNLQIKKVFPDTVLYTGEDIRHNVFALFKSKHFELQAEYLNAHFDNEKSANGYYILSAINTKKSQIVLMFESYKNTYERSRQYIHLGYNYLINKNKTKLFFDNFFQIGNGAINNYRASIQLQMFFR